MKLILITYYTSEETGVIENYYGFEADDIEISKIKLYELATEQRKKVEDWNFNHNTILREYQSIPVNHKLKNIKADEYLEKIKESSSKRPGAEIDWFGHKINYYDLLTEYNEFDIFELNEWWKSKTAQY